MATAKREIYARGAVQLRNHDRPRVAEKMCPGAMGLYFFLLLQARGEQTHGDVLDLAAYESWGAPTAYRKKQEAALIAAGLVERRGDRLVVVKYLEHNDGPEEIAAAKDRVNLRQDKKRHPEKYATVTRDTHVTAPALSPGLPISYSSSPSGSGSADHRSEDPDSSPRADDEAPDSRHVFAVGTSTTLDALGEFDAAVSQATGKPFALEFARWHPEALAKAMNAHGPPDLRRAGELIRWMQTSVGVWVRSAEPKMITPAKWLEWLNAGRPANTNARRGTGGGPRGDRQGLDGWTPPAWTGTDDPLGGDS